MIKRIGYLLTDFPIPNMTYVLNEITELMELAIPLEILSLDRPRHKNIHDDYYRHGLDRKTLYLPHKRDLEGNDIGSLKTLFRGFTALLTNRFLNFTQKWKLLSYCRDSNLGNILSVRRFLACLDITGGIKRNQTQLIYVHLGNNAHYLLPGNAGSSDSTQWISGCRQ